ncbi:hypothetical protein A6A19_08515 [Actinobacillus delphinicola]|uniref:UPF0056 membrane protein n=1 Tax=Actinobacillus delphinicola TaxID=51161 RepID=A0A448TVC6_9PAST|nr:YchE family NAAT transporter [Actinobacillus delphinicola]MDG6898017.1 hypothetical protein [Actinobacillus delphinicola]VEJ09884.1 MarC family integral membrane protein [Actinobacillus delphinicola]
MDIGTCLQFFVSLIALVNPIGVIPIFYSMTSDFPKEEQERMIFITCLTLTIMLLISFFFGNAILHAFNISIDSFRIAGGIVLGSIAMTMINGKIGENKMNKEEKGDDISNYTNLAIVPLAIPLMAGPGSISAAIVFGVNSHTLVEYGMSSVTIIAFCICCYFLLRYSKPVMMRLGKTGANVVTRIMGLILLSLGIEMIVTALKNFGIL